MEDKNIDEIIARYKLPLALGFVGLVLLVGGVLSSGLLQKTFNSSSKNQFVKTAQTTAVQNPSVIAVDVSGEVVNPGVYKLSSGSRVEEALKAAGGVTGSADPVYLSKSVNLAQKLVDGMKIYIPKTQEAGSSGTPVLGVGTQQSGLININNASVSELDKLPGVGAVTAQSIIDKRPYGDIGELLSKKVVTRATYEKIKGLVSVY